MTSADRHSGLCSALHVVVCSWAQGQHGGAQRKPGRELDRDRVEGAQQGARPDAADVCAHLLALVGRRRQYTDEFKVEAVRLGEGVGWPHQDKMREDYGLPTEGPAPVRGLVHPEAATIDQRDPLPRVRLAVDGGRPQNRLDVTLGVQGQAGARPVQQQLADLGRAAGQGIPPQVALRQLLVFAGGGHVRKPVKGMLRGGRFGIGQRYYCIALTILRTCCAHSAHFMAEPESRRLTES